MNKPKVPVGVTNRYLRLIHWHRLVIPPGTNVKVTTRYQWRASSIDSIYPKSTYRYENEPVAMLT